MTGRARCRRFKSGVRHVHEPYRGGRGPDADPPRGESGSRRDHCAELGDGHGRRGFDGSRRVWHHAVPGVECGASHRAVPDRVGDLSGAGAGRQPARADPHGRVDELRGAAHLGQRADLLCRVHRDRRDRLLVAGQRKRGQVQFAGTARRVLRTNWTCPLFRQPAELAEQTGESVESMREAIDWLCQKAQRKRGQVQFAGTARRVLRTNWTCPLFRHTRSFGSRTPPARHAPATTSPRA